MNSHLEKYKDTDVESLKTNLLNNYFFHIQLFF